MAKVTQDGEYTATSWRRVVGGRWRRGPQAALGLLTAQLKQQNPIEMQGDCSELKW